MALEYMILSSVLFSIGLAVVIIKKNAIFVLIGIELMLNASNINFVVMDSGDFKGQFFALFVIVIAVAEAAVGLVLIFKVYQYFNTINLNQINELKE